MSISEIGPCGGDGGASFRMDITATDQKLKVTNILINYAEAVDGLQVVYRVNGNTFLSQHWGGNGGVNPPEQIHFGENEFLISVNGTYGPFYSVVANMIRSITFVTNLSTYGPYGLQEGLPFYLSAGPNKSIVGLFGGAGVYIDRIGILVQSLTPNIYRSAGIFQLGPCGGSGGDPFSMDIINAQNIKLLKIQIYFDAGIHGILVAYKIDSNVVTSRLWGINTGTSTEIIFGANEYLTSLSGYVSPYGGYKLVMRSLTFMTNMKTYGPYGVQEGLPFTLPAGNGKIVGFFGRSGSFIDNIGVLVKPNPTN